MGLGSLGEPRQLDKATVRTPVDHAPRTRDDSLRRRGRLMKYVFLVDTYASECLKVVSVLSSFKDVELPVRPRPGRPSRAQRARADGPPVRERGSVVSQHAGHRRRRPTLATGRRLDWSSSKRYAEDSGKRLRSCVRQREPWWEEDDPFFDVRPFTGLDHDAAHGPIRPTIEGSSWPCSACWGATCTATTGPLPTREV